MTECEHTTALSHCTVTTIAAVAIVNVFIVVATAKKNETEDVSLTNDSKAKNTEKSIKLRFE